MRISRPIPNFDWDRMKAQILSGFPYDVKYGGFLVQISPLLFAFNLENVSRYFASPGLELLSKANTCRAHDIRLLENGHRAI
jgi:hypothetical protein